MSQATNNNALLGTPLYMSPEAALGKNIELDARADQWSLAVVVYRAISGRLPFDAESTLGILYQVVNTEPLPLPQLAPGVPPYVLAAVARAMSKDREHRFSSMADFVRALSGAQLPLQSGRRKTSDGTTFILDAPAQTLSLPLGLATVRSTPRGSMHRTMIGAVAGTALLVGGGYWLLSEQLHSRREASAMTDADRSLKLPATSAPSIVIPDMAVPLDLGVKDLASRREAPMRTAPAGRSKTLPIKPRETDATPPASSLEPGI